MAKRTVRKPVGVAMIPGHIVVVCDDGAAFSFDSTGEPKWTRLPPIEGTEAATRPES